MLSGSLGGRQLYQPLRCGFYNGLAAALSEEAADAVCVSAGGKAAKNVLILMSDTGGGHRASAEALRDAFLIEFGDAYQVCWPRPMPFIQYFRSNFFLLAEFSLQLAQVFVRDLGKEYGGWPLNDMERSYKFMIRHLRLWKVTFHGTSPRWVHGVYLAALAYFYAKYISMLTESVVFTSYVLNSD
jgi:1,2-diacylglycerol 3-beta-galactosyltransferase